MKNGQTWMIVLGLYTTGSAMMVTDIGLEGFWNLHAVFIPFVALVIGMGATGMGTDEKPKSSLQAIVGSVLGGISGAALGGVAAGYGGAFFGFLIGTGIGAGLGDFGIKAGIGASLGAFPGAFIGWFVGSLLIGEGLDGLEENLVIYGGFLVGAIIGTFIGVKMDRKKREGDKRRKKKWTHDDMSEEIGQATSSSLQNKSAETSLQEQGTLKKKQQPLSSQKSSYQEDPSQQRRATTQRQPDPKGSYDPGGMKFKSNLSAEEIREELEYLEEEEGMIDTREVESALEEKDVHRAEEALKELKEKYSKYKEIIEKLESLDYRKSSLAQQLADKELDRDTYNNAIKNIEHKKADLEKKLNKLREEIIYEDYQKPF